MHEREKMRDDEMKEPASNLWLCNLSASVQHEVQKTAVLHSKKLHNLS